MIQVEYLPIVLTGLGIIVSIMYYTSVLRNANKTREAQLFMQVYDKWSDTDMQKAYEVVNNAKFSTFEQYMERQAKDEDFRWAMGKIIGFYEGVGVLVREGLVDIRLVALLMTGTTLNFWGKIEPHIDRIREQAYPRVCIETEYLANKLREYIKNHPEIEA
jgi:hypothetical protein